MLFRGELRMGAHADSVGGMAAACLTSPLDVVKTRLQSDFYQKQLLENRRKAGTLANRGMVREGLRHFSETFAILHEVYRIEGWRALFKGLGPNLSGVVPARYGLRISRAFFTDHPAP